MKLSNIKKIRGQGMSEYLVIVALIAVAAIAVTALFGNVAKNQVAAISSELSGGTSAQSDLARDDADLDATRGVTDANAQTNLSNFDQNSSVVSTGGGRDAAAQ